MSWGEQLETLGIWEKSGEEKQKFDRKMEILEEKKLENKYVLCAQYHCCNTVSLTVIYY